MKKIRLIDPLPWGCNGKSASVYVDEKGILSSFNMVMENAKYGLYLAKPNQATLLRSGEMGLFISWFSFAKISILICPHGWMAMGNERRGSLLLLRWWTTQTEFLLFYLLKIFHKIIFSKEKIFSFNIIMASIYLGALIRACLADFSSHSDVLSLVV